MKNLSAKQYILLFLGIALFVFIASVSSILYADAVVEESADGKVYTSVQDIPEKKVALLLGTNKYTLSGRENLFYIYRLQAIEDLYTADKIEFVLISGDNGTQEYNEPEQMRDDLIAAGIPEDHIYLDYAGFRTWDSIIRANKVFLENDFIIVSQEFHNKRALYIAEKNDIDAIAYNATDVPVARSPRIWLRERLARVKLLLDVLFNTNPRFLGDTIVIE